jgi:hypothetical protein
MQPASTTQEAARARASVEDTRRHGAHAMVAMAAVGALESLGCIFNDLDVPGILCQIAGYAAWVAAAVLYCRWLYRAYGDAALLRGPALRFKPSEAVASFFLPFVGLVRPYRVLVDLHDASDPRRDLPERSPAAIGGARAPWDKVFPARSWWALWLLAPVATSILDNASVLGQLRSLDVLTDPSALLAESEGDGGMRLIAAAIHLGLAALAICVVRSVVARQDERLRRIEATAATSSTSTPTSGA